MTAARLSPAASLLRTSKLFALPPAIALPVPEPSSEPVPRSDTATTIYPTRAAIETPLTSLGRGDWGFKRPLPLKSTTKSGSPTVRLNKGIDTAEHIADFDSAADHVLTLKKFQELNQPIQHPRTRDDTGKVHLGAFRRGYDNTTNLSESAPAYAKYSGVWPSLSPSDLQKEMPDALQSQSQANTEEEIINPSRTSSKVAAPRRWRYKGPSLVQMSGLEFDQWMGTLDSSKRWAFREEIRRIVLAKKRSTHIANAQDEGRVGEVDPATLQASEEEIVEYLKRLRQQPKEFGPLIAKFLDLPGGPSAHGVSVTIDDVWKYGRETVASESYGENGPPKTHPSAGLSYIHTARFAQNHPLFGPQDQKLPVVARQVKTRARGPNNVASLGVAGFIVEKDTYKGTKEHNTPAFEPQAGGQKTVVRPDRAEIDEKGALKFMVKMAPEYQVEDEKPVHGSMVSDARVAALRPAKGASSRVMQPLTRSGSSVLDYKKRDDLTSGGSEGDFDFLSKTP